LSAPVVPAVINRTLRSQGLGRRPLDVVLSDLDRHLDALTGWLGDGTWLVGDRISLADISVFAQLDCINGTREGEERISARPRLREWMNSVARATD
jgi:glutathione S-transferase